MFRPMLASALLLALFTFAATGLVVFTHDATAERIVQAEKAAFVRTVETLVPRARYDNDLTADRLEVSDPLLGTRAPVAVYRARRGGEPVAAVLNAVAPDGYSGDIRLLVAINADGTLAGVRVTGHRETPGLGDKIEAERSDWITHFTGRSLADPAPEQWAVKKDGGVFDQFSGATITPRAVVKAVHNTLLFVQTHRAELFDASAPQEVIP